MMKIYIKHLNQNILKFALIYEFEDGFKIINGFHTYLEAKLQLQSEKNYFITPERILEWEIDNKRYYATHNGHAQDQREMAKLIK